MGLQLGERVHARGHRDALGADGLGGGNVFGRVTDDNHPASLQRQAELRRAPPRAGRQDFGTIDRIVTEPAKAEAVVDPGVAQFDAGAFAQIPGTEAQGQIGASLGQIEHAQDAVVNANSVVGGCLFLQNAQIEGERGVHLDQQFGFRSKTLGEGQ